MTVPNPQRVTPHVRRKGHRLHHEGRVHRIPGSFVVLVEGDTPGSVYAIPCQGGPDLAAENVALREALHAIVARPAIVQSPEDDAQAIHAMQVIALGALSDDTPRGEAQVLGCTCPHHGVCGHIIAARNLNQAA